ncbi:MAG: hypothetical protein FWG63_02275 [Defluviitaleaceae bacterium]|nr:hypothetical protein [Defluviitaleaceae bacterium]
MSKFPLHIKEKELESYSLYKEKVALIDTEIEEIKEQLTLVEEYYVNISPVLSDMPKSENINRDKVGNAIIKIENDRERYTKELNNKVAERESYLYQMEKTRLKVSRIKNEQLRKILELRYFKGQTFNEIATQSYENSENKMVAVGLTAAGVRHKINRFFFRNEKRK